MYAPKADSAGGRVGRIAYARTGNDLRRCLHCNRLVASFSLFIIIVMQLSECGNKWNGSTEKTNAKCATAALR